MLVVGNDCAGFRNGAAVLFALPTSLDSREQQNGWQRLSRFTCIFTCVIGHSLFFWQTGPRGVVIWGFCGSEQEI